MPLNSEKIKKNLHSDLTVRVLGSTDSTNNEAKRSAENDGTARVLIAADSQTAGRGRLGRSFYSPSGGLYMTLSIPVTDTAENTQRLTCAAAVAVCEAVGETTGLSPLIKWVNDIYVDGRKVAGILCELVTDELNRPLRVIIGIGINLTTESFPDDIANKAGRIGHADPDRLCAIIADKMIDMLDHLDDDSYIEKYASLNLCIGRTIRYTDRDGEHTAKAISIAPDGSLTVDENGFPRRLNSGEISLSGSLW